MSKKTVIDEAKVEPKLNWKGKLREGTRRPVSKPASEPVSCGGGSKRLGQDSKFATVLSSDDSKLGCREP